MIITIRKIKELEDAEHPNNIEEGFEYTGLVFREPKVGECFRIGDMRTSTVREILPENTFRTVNSVYQWEKVSE